MAVRCPMCPLCGWPPQMAISHEQAFCGNEDCSALMWNPSLPAAENLHYWSTACQHGIHDECRQVCKFCDESCRCGCHREV